MACHILGAPNMALRLGAPTSVECLSKEGTSPFQFPKKSVIRFDFPQRGSMPPVKIFWHDGMKTQPEIAGVPQGEWLGDLPGLPMNRPAGAGQGGGQGAAQAPAMTPEMRARRAQGMNKGYVGRVFDYETYQKVKAAENVRMPSPDGSVFIGDKGMLTTGTYGEQTRLLPTEKMADYQFPIKTLSRSPGHYQDWIRACKGGDPACSNFNVSAPFVEWMLLGVIALRCEGKLEWDAAKMQFSNNKEANQYLKPHVRKGWSHDLKVT